MSQLAEPKHGEIWIADIDKRRPVVILTRDPLGSFLHSVLIAPVTSKKRMLSTEVPVGPAEGIHLESVASFDNMQQVSREKLRNRVGVVSTETAERICFALSVATGCADLDLGDFAT
jgi:mRNA interferase MazF